MKSIRLSTTLLFIFLTVGYFGNVSAQDASDVVVMLNGEQKEGKVTGVSSDAIKFKYTGEDLEYELKKENISQIKFASGRVEVFNQSQQAPSPAPSTSASATTAADRQNKIAVVPFDIISNDPGVDPQSMGHNIQNNCVNSLRHNTNGLIVQDSRTTNAILAQNNIGSTELLTIMPKDLAIMLGVEYVLIGSTEIQNTGSSTYGSGITSYKDKEKKDGDRDNNKKESKGYEVSSGSSTTTLEYDVHVSLNIFTDEGKNIYSETREPFGTDIDQYNGALDYMIKRTPFGTKHK